LNPAAEEKCFACDHSLAAATPAAVDQSGLQRTLRQRYRLLRQIGTGGFAAVYKAEDTQLGNRVVAVKEMSARGLTPAETQEATESFHQEALLLARLSHPNLPRIYEQFEEGGRWYLVMDFIEGQTLEDYLKDRGGRLPVKEALQLAIQLTNVLGYLHARQPPIVFRDLKPGNVMLTPDGRVYLIDFGIARLFKPGQAKDTIAFGSPGYAAPEQYGKAQTTPRSDVFSLGALLHHMISGTDPSDTPFRFKPLTMPRPAGLSNLIDRMVDLDVAKRPATMELVRTDLEHMLNSPAPWRADDVRAPTPNPYTSPSLATTRAFPSVSPSPPSWQVQNTNQFTQGGQVPPPVQKKKKRHWFIWVAAAIIGYLVLANLFHSSPPSNPIDGPPVYNNPVSTTPVHSGAAVYAVAWSPDGSRLAFGGADSELDLMGTSEHVVTLNLQVVTTMAWSPDGQYLAVAGDSQSIFLLGDDGQVVTSYDTATSQVNAVAWSPNQPILAIGGNDGQVIFADALSGTNRSSSQLDTDPITAVAWSPNGRYLAIGGADQLVRIWDNTAQKVVYTYQDSAAINAVAWSADGNSIASVDAAGSVATWDAQTGNNQTFYSNATGPISTSVAWSSNDTYLAVGDDGDNVRVWQVGNTTPIYTYMNHKAAVRSVSWESNSTIVASGSYDGTVQVWDALNGNTQQTYEQP
jgi:serine/threonine protein kinase